MRKISDLLRQEVSAKAAKAATDVLWQEGNGIGAYCLGGKILLGCGVGWGLLTLIPIICKTPMREYIWMPVLAAVQIIVGGALIILSKKSKRFQEWALRDFQKSLKQKKKLEEKVKAGKRTLPVTHGDVLALKICGVIVAVIIIVIGIGYLQGWVV